jgi:hypothetical protein
VALRTKWHRANARRSDTRTGGSASSWRSHVTEEALLRIINIAPNISLGGRTAPAEDRFAGQLMYETQGQPPDTPNFVRHWGESAFRDREDDGIGAFHWLDEGFGHAGAMPTVPCCSGLAEIVNRVDGAVEPTR